MNPKQRVANAMKRVTGARNYVEQKFPEVYRQTAEDWEELFVLLTKAPWSHKGQDRFFVSFGKRFNELKDRCRSQFSDR